MGAVDLRFFSPGLSGICPVISGIRGKILKRVGLEKEPEKSCAEGKGIRKKFFGCRKVTGGLIEVTAGVKTCITMTLTIFNL